MSTFIVLWLVSCIIAFVCLVKLAKSEMGWGEMSCSDIILFVILSMFGPMTILTCGIIWIIEVTSRSNFESSRLCKKITNLVNKYL